MFQHNREREEVCFLPITCSLPRRLLAYFRGGYSGKKRAARFVGVCVRACESSVCAQVLGVRKVSGTGMIEVVFYIGRECKQL